MTESSLPIPQPYALPVQIAWVCCWVLMMTPAYALAAKRLRDVDGSVLRFLLIVPPPVLGLTLPWVIDPPKAAHGIVIGVTFTCGLLLTIALGFKKGQAST
ncbi:hypothetical protein [Aureimonas sp. AU20]|uniref:hypothetical protein n=1 Tax=Aureimonas sp. AU20 TaxID=1349819 RepID=UPI0007847FE6|nr:hypothetical protein [Aureimonas sp. AU20]